ncbi:MAG: hypothetical protein SGARI_005738 [Bacillariaceae sp.]
MAGSNASVDGTDDNNVDTQYVEGEDLDHIFDDDIESVGEPVALEQASPFIRNPNISTDMAEGLLRSMFMNNA